MPGLLWKVGFKNLSREAVTPCGPSDRCLFQAKGRAARRATKDIQRNSAEVKIGCDRPGSKQGPRDR